MKTGKSLRELAGEIESQRDRKVDFTATTPDIQVVANTNEQTKKALPILFDVNSVGKFPVKELALTQVAEHTKIPVTYARKMAEEAPQLLADNINVWFQQNKTQRRLVRVLDGNARAFLSDRYQRIDNFDVANVTLQAFAEHKDLEVVSSEITENRLYIKATLRSLTRTVKSKRVGDVVEAGVTVINSEVGLGAVAVQPFARFLFCLNGATYNKAKRFTHVGSKIEGAEIGYLSDETLKAGDRFDILRIKDALAHAFDEQAFDGWIERLNGATEKEIEAKNVTKAIEVLSEKLVLTKVEGDSVLAHLIQGGDLSQYGLFNAVTRTAEDAANYDRASELEALGPKIIDLGANEWREIAQAA